MQHNRKECRAERSFLALSRLEEKGAALTDLPCHDNICFKDMVRHTNHMNGIIHIYYH